MNSWAKRGVQTFEQLGQKGCSNGVETVFKRCSPGERLSRALSGKILKSLGLKTATSGSKVRCAAQQEQLGEELVGSRWQKQVVSHTYSDSVQVFECLMRCSNTVQTPAVCNCLNSDLERCSNV